MVKARVAVKEVVSGAQALRTYLSNRRSYRAVARPFASIRVDPTDVRGKVSVSHEELPAGTILPGDWDLHVSAFTDSPKYKALVEHFQFGVPWEETYLFRHTYALRLEQTGSVLGLGSLDEVACHYRRHVDPLYESIRARGFSSGSWRRQVRAAFVHVGRAGEIIWGTGGNHRLAIAKILGLPSIPVRVHIRHHRWQTLRDQVASGVATIDPGLQSHPDLADVLPHRSPQAPIGAT